MLALFLMMFFQSTLHVTVMFDLPSHYVVNLSCDQGQFPSYEDILPLPSTREEAKSKISKVICRSEKSDEKAKRGSRISKMNEMNATMKKNGGQPIQFDKPDYQVRFSMSFNKAGKRINSDPRVAFSFNY